MAEAFIGGYGKGISFADEDQASLLLKASRAAHKEAGKVKR